MADIETRVALVEKDVQQTNVLLSKLDTAIEKIAGFSNDITKMLAVHEERFSLRETVEEDLYRLIELRREETQLAVKDFNRQLADATKSQNEALTQTAQQIMNAIAEVKTAIKEDNKANVKRDEEIEKRVASLEMWRWALIGGGVVLGFLLKGVLPLVAKMILP